MKFWGVDLVVEGASCCAEVEVGLVEGVSWVEVEVEGAATAEEEEEESFITMLYDVDVQ